jgi:hypothetical protein
MSTFIGMRYKDFYTLLFIVYTPAGARVGYSLLQ